MKMRLRWLPLVTIAAVGVSAACKGGSDPDNPDSLFNEVVITPSTGNVAVGSTLQLRAAVTGAPGTPQGVTWKALDEAIATVDQNGLVTGRDGGTGRIRAIWVRDTTNFTDAFINVTDGPIVEGGARSFRR